jgi:hypothetical protein
VLAQIPGVIELAGLQIRFRCRDVGQRRLGQDRLGDIVDRAVRDFMNETDVLVFAGGYARDDVPPVISGSKTASRPRRP